MNDYICHMYMYHVLITTLAKPHGVNTVEDQRERKSRILELQAQTAPGDF